MSTPGKEILESAEETIRCHGLLKGGERVIVGVSGGSDSVCLLYLLRELAPRWRIDLWIAHLHHGLRGSEADGDEAFVISLAQGLGYPIVTHRVDVASYAREKGLSKQVAARELRYAFFERVARENQARLVALGHTADDQVETLLMRLLRGTGSAGLQGIPVLRDGFIIRPLLSVSHSEIVEYLKERKIVFREDSSNQETRYVRNRIRLELLPLLERDYNPRIRETLSREAFLLAQEGMYLDEECKRLFLRLGTRENEEIRFPTVPLQALHPALRWRVLRLGIHHLLGGLQGFGMNHILAADLLLQREGSPRIQLPRGLWVIREQDDLILLRRGEQSHPSWQVPLAIPGSVDSESLPFRVVTRLSRLAALKNSRDAAVFDWERLPRPLVIRNWREGDFFYPNGLGGKKKLQDFFVDQKIPRRERRGIPLLASPEGILWVMGLRLDGRFLADARTRTRLVVNLQRKG